MVWLFTIVNHLSLSVSQSLPLLYNHMCEEGVTSEMYLMDWNMALFTKVQYS